MKSTNFKKIIKEAVKEAIQEELKEILLEAVKAPKAQNITENQSVSHKNTKSSPSLDVRKSYMDVLNDTSLNFSSKDVAKFTPQGQDPVNGNLGSGEVGIDQIQNLMNIK